MTETPGTPRSRGNLPGLKQVAAIWPMAQFLISVSLVVAALLWLLKHPGSAQRPLVAADSATESAVRVDGTAIQVRRDSPLGQRLLHGIHQVALVDTTDPLLRVTGVVIASRRPGKNGDTEFWQFNTPELLATYSDWERAAVDLQFNRSLLVQVRELARVSESGLQQSIERMEKLVRSGTETARDLASLRTQLLQTQVQGRKDIYQAEAAIKTAERSLATLNLQLARFGLDPDWMRTATPDLDVVSAEVPESLLSRVRQGQSAFARFYGLPDEEFTGTISTISPVLSTEQRTLRVLLILNDPQDRLRPGMFAKVGLGTNPRHAVRIPASGVVHVGQRDFVLAVQPEQSSPAGEGDGAPKDSRQFLDLRAVPVQIAVTIGDAVEIESGLTEGVRIVGQDAVLLKPLIVESLQHSSPRPASHDAELSDEGEL